MWNELCLCEWSCEVLQRLPWVFMVSCICRADGLPLKCSHRALYQNTSSSVWPQCYLTYADRCSCSCWMVLQCYTWVISVSMGVPLVFRALKMTFIVRKPSFHVVKYLTEHWNKFYLCLQAGFNYLRNLSKTTTSSSLVSWTCLACTYLIAVSASNHPVLPINCLQEWPSKSKLSQVWTKLRRLFPLVLNFLTFTIVRF